MRSRGALVLVVAAACLTGLAGCSSSGKLADLLPGNSGDSATPPAADPGDTTSSLALPPPVSDPGPEHVTPTAGLLGENPNDDLQRGKRYFRANDFGLAEKSFQSAVEHHPRDAEAWVDLAASYDRLHRFDLSDRAYAEAIRLIGPTPEILNDQGFSYMLRGDYARARKKLLQARARDPANPYVRANLQLLDEAAQESKAVE